MTSRDDRGGPRRAGPPRRAKGYERAAACPDSLAAHPAVREAAATGDQDVVFDEACNVVPATAYERLTEVSVLAQLP